jgi:hypothetical protein
MNRVMPVIRYGAEGIISGWGVSKADITLPGLCNTIVVEYVFGALRMNNFFA